jgi:hypothetical protein
MTNYLETLTYWNSYVSRHMRHVCQRNLRSLCNVAGGDIVRRLALGPDQELITETADYPDGQGFSPVE